MNCPRILTKPGDRETAACCMYQRATCSAENTVVWQHWYASCILL